MAFSSRSKSKPSEPLTEQELYQYALRSLGRKMRTVAELKRLMRLRVEPGEAGDAKMNLVVARLKEQRYLSDTRYAAEFTRLRQENEKFGRRRVQQDLMQRGVHGDIIGKTLDAAYADVPEQDLARRFIERKRLRKPGNEKETARVVRMLTRAGFSMGAIFAVLKAWKLDEATLEASREILSAADEVEPGTDVGE